MFYDKTAVLGKIFSCLRHAEVLKVRKRFRCFPSFRSSFNCIELSKSIKYIHDVATPSADVLHNSRKLWSNEGY